MGCIESTPIAPQQRQVYYVPQQQPVTMTKTVYEDPINYNTRYPPAYNPNAYPQHAPPPYNPYAQPVNQPVQYYTVNTGYPVYQNYPNYQQNNGMGVLGTMGAVAGGVIVGDMIGDMLFD